MVSSRIHLATVDDADRIAELVRAAFEEYRGVLVPPSAAHAETGASIRSKLEIGGAFLVEADGEDVGCVVFYRQEGDLYFGRLSVLPDYRGEGLAIRLVAAVEDEARVHGFAATRLGARLALPQNVGLFESLGYEVHKLESHLGFDQPTSVTMRKLL